MSVSAVPTEALSGKEVAAATAEREPLLVLKFGSSVLETAADLPAVAGEIYRQRRKGNRVIAVVSALAGETDRLLLEASATCDGVDCSGTAELVSLGEEHTASLLKIACERIGLKAALCRPEELGLHTIGAELDADLDEFLPFALARKLDQAGLVIVPGFVGLSRLGARTLLGRGGSDLTAVILGGGLGARTVRLYKDVDGVFETDPAANPAARKFEEVGYEDALRVASKLVHSKAVAFASAKDLPIEVESIGSSSPTRIGRKSSLASAGAPKRPIRIALAGYGVVGQALAKRLTGDERFVFSSILVRDPARPRGVEPPVPLTSDLYAFANAEADVLIELLSCSQTGAALCCSKLRNGIPVATASKRVVSDRFAELAASAEAGGTRLVYSAAVGGSAPILETIERAKSEGEVSQVRGILNGTVNFVLQRLADGTSLDDALRIARERGFAEEDSVADLSGGDAAAKLRLIAERAFGVSPDQVHVETERLDEQLASTIQASGERWIQLSEVRLEDGEISARVRLCRACEVDLWAAPDEWNVGAISLAGGEEIGVQGRGAGGPATAEAVLADLHDLFEDWTSRARNDEEASSTAAAPKVLAG